MVIKFYGTRGSVAVANKETKKYGGNTTCFYVESNSGDAIVIDAGTGIRELGNYLIENKKDTIHLILPSILPPIIAVLHRILPFIVES